MFGTLLYDPDRMRYDSRTITKVGPGSTGTSVEMNSASGSYRAAKQYYRGSPFGVWQTDFEKMTLSRIEGSDPPFGSNDRAKATFDTKRKRILYYGAQDESSGKKCNQLYAFPLATGKWQKLTPKLHTETGEAPQIKFWNYCYSSTHDCLMIAAGESGTWIYDCESNTLKRLDLENEVGTAGGVVYSERYDLFLMLDGHGYRPQQVWAFRYKP
jgi:hypothetical protein